MKTEPEVQFDVSEGEHAPELYAEVAVADAIDGLDAVDAAARERYNRDGFLAIENAFDAAEVQDAINGIDDLVMGKREGFKGVVYERKAKEILPTLPVEQRLDAVRKFVDFVSYEPRLKHLCFHAKLMKVIADLVGSEPQLFQEMALIKPPRIGREKPWHQDHAYFDLPIGSRIVGVWIALDEATVENGCMRVLTGGHLEGPRLHFQRRDWQICDNDMAGVRPVAVPLRPGGLMLFDGLLPHGTPTNHSPRRRRALQFHYIGQAVPKTTTEERLAIFGSEGKNVTC